jgi:hypothetical protein
MSYRLSAQVIGAEELQAAFRRAPELVGRELKRAIDSVAYHVEGKAKGYAPHKYGNLRSSITTEPARVTLNNVEAKVGTNLTYARYQEEGTGIYGPREAFITPKNGRVLAWKSDGKWHFAKRVRGIRPKWYFRRAKEESVTFLTEQLRGALGRIVTSLAK